MKPLFTFLFIAMAFIATAQNVGIGTTTPSAKLEVKNALKNTVKISSNSYNDTSELILSNRTPFNEGTDFTFRSMRENGLFISSTSDLTGNIFDSIMVLTPQGGVGIGGAYPNNSAILEIKSTNRGFLMPRMTSLQRGAIIAPPIGLIVFDLTTQSFWHRTATQWVEMASMSSFINEIRDADGNTKVQVEKNANDDTIRFVSKGFEIAKFTSKALHLDTAGSVFIGKNAGRLDGGIDRYGNPLTANTFIGSRAGEINRYGSDNVYVGYGAGSAEKGNWNTYIGYMAGNKLVADSSDNNTFIGRYAGALSNGSGNIQIGIYAGAYNDGTNNVFIGNSTGGGQYVGSDNGSNNVVIGNGAGPVNIFSSSNNILIGNNVAATDTFSNRLYINNGACDSTTALIYGKFDSNYVRVNGDLKITGELQGDVRIAGELQRPLQTGNANMIPICYGNVTAAGGINLSSSTNNFTVSKFSTGIYLITITGESYQFQLYHSIVTAVNSTTPTITTTGSGGGQLQVYTWNAAGVASDSQFCFVVYKK